MSPQNYSSMAGRNWQRAIASERAALKIANALRQKRITPKRRPSLSTPKPSLLDSRTFLYNIIRTHSHRPLSKIYRTYLTSLILLNVVVFVWSTDEYYLQNFTGWFQAFEVVSVCLFAMDYVIRIYTAPQSKRITRGGRLSPGTARVRWLLSSEGLIDLASILPFLLELCFHGINLPNLAYLRVLRLSRLLKASIFKDSWDCVARVFYYNRSILGVSFSLCMVLLILTSTAMYYLGPEASDTDDITDDFSSILACLYLCVLMLTGQGGPGGTLPWYTKVVCCVTAAFSVALFAIPASMLTWGFEAEAERLMVKQHLRKVERAKRVAKGLPADPISSSSSSDEAANKDWEDYEQVVVGHEDEEEPPHPADAATHGINLTALQQRRASLAFHALDADSDGVLTHTELLEGCGSDLGLDVVADDTQLTIADWLQLLGKAYSSGTVKAQVLDRRLDGVASCGRIETSLQATQIEEIKRELSQIKAAVMQGAA
uniref:EF-hand domain-containing protein n=1 Tax=Eutreptiella gymnastica TaxID=73025 RepID=A0A7S1N5H5_9EUGL